VNILEAGLVFLAVVKLRQNVMKRTGNLKGKLVFEGN